MTSQDLDRILNSEKTLEPSPHFALNVMAAVRREADDPPALHFPWWRFVAGIAASGGMAAGGTALLSHAEVLAIPIPAPVPAIVYAFAMLLVSLAVAAMPRLLSKP